MKEILELENEQFNGNFYKFQSRMYAYFIYQLEIKNVEKLTSDMYPKSILKNVIYEGIYAKPDHMYSEIIEQCIKDMKKQKIITHKKVGDTWYLEILCKPKFLSEELLEKYLLYFKREGKVDIRNLSIFKIKLFCWQCKDIVDIFTPIYGLKDNEYIDYINKENSVVVKNISILGDNEIIDEEIAKRYETIKKKYTKQSDETYYLNVCKCGAVQGRFYLHSAIIDMINNKIYIGKD